MNIKKYITPLNVFLAIITLSCVVIAVQSIRGGNVEIDQTFTGIES